MCSSDLAVRRLAAASGLPVHADIGSPTPGALRDWCADRGVGAITYEVEHAPLPALAARHLDGIVTLPDDEILGGLRFAMERMKQVVEPAGAASLAALLFGRIPVGTGDRVMVILSGGNVDLPRIPEFFATAKAVPGA